MSADRLFPINGGLRALVFCFTSAYLLVGLAGCFSQERAVLSKTVLTINGKDVSTKEFADRLALRLKGYDALFVKDDANLDRVKEETVQAYLLEFIARDYAEKHGITADKKDIDAKVAELKAGYPDDFAFRRALADENMPIEKWRDDLAFTILQKKIFATVTANLPEPTEAEMKAYYEAHKSEFQTVARVRLRQIVLEKEDDAKRILEDLGNGGKMEALAKKFSIAPEGLNGGDTGWIEKGTLDVFDMALKMPVGSRSKILKSPYGWHIYDVLKKEPDARLSFPEAKAKIRARLIETKAQQAFSNWLEEQVRKSSVKRNDAVIRAIKVTTRGS